MTNQTASAVHVKARPMWAPLVVFALIPFLLAVTVPDSAGVWSATPTPKLTESKFLLRDVPVPVVVAPAAAPGADPNAETPKIEVILPPPPPPPATKTRGRATVSAGMTSTQFCSAGGGASVGASSLSGLLEAVNTERARLGIGPLSWSDSLANSAQSWSNQMAADQGNKSEYNLRTSAGLELVRVESGSRSSTWHATVFRHSGSGGENIFFRYGDSAASIGGAHRGFMSSPGHCKQVMNPKYTKFGAGDAVSSDGGYFATERFS